MLRQLWSKASCPPAKCPPAKRPLFSLDLPAVIVVLIDILPNWGLFGLIKQICHASVGIVMEYLPSGWWFSRGRSPSENRPPSGRHSIRIPTLAWHICIMYLRRLQWSWVATCCEGWYHKILLILKHVIFEICTCDSYDVHESPHAARVDIAEVVILHEYLGEVDNGPGAGQESATVDGGLATQEATAELTLLTCLHRLPATRLTRYRLTPLNNTINNSKSVHFSKLTIFHTYGYSHFNAFFTKFFFITQMVIVF